MKRKRKPAAKPTAKEVGKRQLKAGMILVNKGEVKTRYKIRKVSCGIDGKAGPYLDLMDVATGEKLGHDTSFDSAYATYTVQVKAGRR